MSNKKDKFMYDPRVVEEAVFKVFNTQDEVAEALGLTQAAVSKALKNPSDIFVRKLNKLGIVIKSNKNSFNHTNTQSVGNIDFSPTNNDEDVDMIIKGALKDVSLNADSKSYILLLKKLVNNNESLVGDLRKQIAFYEEQLQQKDNIINKLLEK